MKEAIQKAKQEGWRCKQHTEQSYPDEKWQFVTSDPTFWQALGKAEGWEDPEKGDDFPEAEVLDLKQTGWNARWHHFIDHLAEGKDANSFFTNLIK